jgi:hypothetical protein
MKSPREITVNLPCGAGGLNSNYNVYRIPPQQLVRAQNVRFDNQAINKAPGAALLDTISDAGICLGASNYFVNAGSEVSLTAWEDTHIYKSSSNNFNATDLGVFGATTEPVVMVPFSNLAESGSTVANRMAFFSKGTTPTTVVGNGGSFTAFTAVSADWATTNAPTGGFLHDFRLCAYGIEAYPHNVYFSTLTDLTDFTGAGRKVMSVYPGEGQKIVAGISYLETACVIFKYPRGIYLIDTVDLTAPVNPAYRVTDAIGGAGPNALCEVNGDNWFICDQGRIHSLNQLRGDIDPKQSDITAQLDIDEFVKRNVDLSKVKWARLHFDPRRQEVIYSFTSKTSSTGINDTAIIVRLPSGQGGPALVSIDKRGDNLYNAIWARQSSIGEHEVLGAGDGGEVYLWNDIQNGVTGYSVDGASYQGVFSHPVTDFSYMDPSFASLQKQFKWLDVQLLPTETESTLSVDVFVDDRYVDTLTMDLALTEAFVFDTAEWDAATFAGVEYQFKRLPLDVTGRKIQFVWYNNSVDQAFIVADAHVTFVPANQTYEEK